MSKGNGFMVGMIIGGIIGGAVALLYAPYNGKRMRKKLVHTADTVKEDVNDFLTTSRDKANELIKEGKKRAETILNDAKKLVS